MTPTTTTQQVSKKLPVDVFSQFSPGDEVLVGSVEVEWWGRGPVCPFHAVDPEDEKEEAEVRALAIPGIKSAWRGTFVERVKGTTDVVIRFAGGFLGPAKYRVPVGFVKPLDYPMEDPPGFAGSNKTTTRP